MCGKSVAVGLVSQTLLQHADKNGELCAGSGQAPVVKAARAAGATRSASTSTRPAKAPKTSPATKGGMTVRRVEVDPEVVQERQQRAERLRLERAEAARARNEIGVSYFDEPGA
ncbi:hypothetical protein GCM10009851_40090 [Herbiconiux moechotypicola]|uniref:Uncharacterized protein n=1 Tax=Herbiconiux moechotypicola TaxID=637393 RepID=A0ABN3E7V4_9MICO